MIQEKGNVAHALIHHADLSMKVYDILFNWLVTRKIKAGDRLIEESLAKELNISRTPIRAALNRLAQDGLIELIPRKGGSVRKLGTKDVDEVYELRQELEGLAIRLSGTKITEKELNKLKKLLKQSKVHFSKDSATHLAKLDSEFHRIINNNCGNKRLINFLESLYNFVQIFRVMGYYHPIRARQAWREHAKILKALIKGDIDKAQKLMKEHISNAKKYILSDFQKGDGNHAFKG